MELKLLKYDPASSIKRRRRRGSPNPRHKVPARAARRIEGRGRGRERIIKGGEEREREVQWITFIASPDGML